MNTNGHKERPILFSGEMVRAILEGRKTQTRRVVKPQPEPCHVELPINEATCEQGWFTNTTLIDGSVPPERMQGDFPREEFAYRWWHCPYGTLGDRLWVRETFQPLFEHGVSIQDVDWKTGSGYAVSYPATDGVQEYYDQSNDNPFSTRCKPAIHMPRWASRITLEITNVRVERLQDITFKDCIAEGIHPIGPENDPACVREEFQQGWNSLNAKRGYGWDKNPWVWVVEFKKL